MKLVGRKILLTPGPATTTYGVKLAQVVPDICPREKEFGRLLESVCTELTRMVSDSGNYSTVLFGGSGTAAVESILSSVVQRDDLVLIVNNGAYGKRMCEIAEAYGLGHLVFHSPSHAALDLTALESLLDNSRRKITHMAVVHHETTTGLLNDIEAIGVLCLRYRIHLIVDAISSFAAIPIDMRKMNIHYLAASSNKNLQAMAGISFVVAETELLEKNKPNKPKNYYLDLHAQYRFFSETYQTRFTPPVQTLYALKQAVEELKEEGIDQRYARYKKCWETLIAGITRLGLKYIASDNLHSKLVTSIFEPNVEGYSFKEMHDYLHSRGYTIYPGKLDEFKTFRIANIGDITFKEIESFLMLLETYLIRKGFVKDA
ncbi:2-aminoethylphosphonate aminotransferase [Cohnella silvisoli]|uniref:2-aminoethylphosphonate--pyruvate transaminase n=1 Tax=Cohnella silvisoli TaxID=2873699 RepID=A0ABV1L2P1_9BACL|nr:2-aminoethylphosphonate--pyruvate transaminase [Cohnella silvisoli]MCD9025954.1 2-aminoethylphosphonate--pyruvate transaminase [Cohnella silvisoli]